MLFSFIDFWNRSLNISYMWDFIVDVGLLIKAGYFHLFYFTYTQAQYNKGQRWWCNCLERDLSILHSWNAIRRTTMISRRIWLIFYEFHIFSSMILCVMFIEIDPFVVLCNFYIKRIMMGNLQQNLIFYFILCHLFTTFANLTKGIEISNQISGGYRVR